MKLRDISPVRCLEWFVVANLGFLGVDIYIAHRANQFREPTEWIPVFFSVAAPLLLVPGALHVGRHSVTRWIDLLVGAASILVGLAGMALHLSSAFFVERTLHSLVYSAPFVAPLAYVGVGLLGVMLRLERDERAIGWWALVLAVGGFFGNFALSLLDHAQNAFFSQTEWVSVYAAALGASFLAVAVVRRERAMLRLCLGVCALEAAVGLSGFVLHGLADLSRRDESFLDRFIFGAPIFAPLLFANLAFLAGLAIACMLRAEHPERTA